MIEISSFFNYATITFCIALSSLGVAIGSSFSSIATIKAIFIQPSARNEILRTSVIGMALIETSAIIGLVVAIMLLMNKDTVVADKYYWSLSNLGIAFSIAISGFTAGIVSSYPVQYACLAIARQPFFNNKILNLMLLTLSFIQTAVIFGFIIALLINSQAIYANSITDSLRHIASGLSIGIGCIGPAIGLAYFAKSDCSGI